jgi:hypothetical protein
VLRNRAVVALVVWTLLVWTTRIRNIWGDDALDTAGKVGRTALALSFTMLAVAVAVAALKRAPGALRATVAALAAWTTGVWLVRSVAIVAGDHDLGFTVVHLVLAAVSVALAAWAVSSTLRERPGRTAAPEPAARAARPGRG